jgi:glycosyltransferase involved in cell wall biosynthesis
VVEHLLGHAAPGEHQTVYLRDEPGSTYAGGGAVAVVRIRAGRGKHTGPFLYFLSCAIHALVRGRYDLIHVHNSDAGFILPILRLRPGTRVMGTFHGTPSLRAKWGRGARAFLRLSEFLFVRFAHHLTSVSDVGSVRGRAVEFIPNGIEPLSVPAGGEAGPLLTRFGLSDGGYLLFAAGRVDVTKGLHDLLAAHRTMPGRPPLMVVGDFTHDPAYARHLAPALDAHGVVVHRALLPKRELALLMSRAAAFLFPSRVEAMSMVLLESLAAGPPVVCSAIRENVALVGSDYPWLFTPGDPASMVRAIQRALTAAPGDLQHLAALRARLLEERSWGRIGGLYRSAYATLLARAVR